MRPALILLGGILIMTATWLSRPTQAVDEIRVASPFIYTFDSEGTLEESPTPQESSSPYWWLNSGGELLMRYGTGSTIRGALSPVDRWQHAYKENNPKDTDNGSHPQNIFRLLTRSIWEDVRMEASFRIKGDNWSESENRNGSNGLFLISNHEDQNNLYYAGVRVDGTAVIKKKRSGEYHILATKKIFPGTYEEGGTSNLLPHDEWIHLRSETVTNTTGVTITLYLQRESGTEWQKILEVQDTRTTSNPIVDGPGRVGIRTDFMDVEFDSVKIEAI